MGMLIPLQPKQQLLKDISERSNQYETIGFGGSRGGGKASSLDSLVLTPFGYKRMGDIKLGDLVNNPDGSVSRVIVLHPIEELPLIKFTFHDGTEARSTENHLWLVWRANRTRKKKGKRVTGISSSEISTTGKIMEWIDNANEQKDAGIVYKNYPLIPVVEEQPFNRTTRLDLLDPYLLGAILGDGSINKKGNVSFGNDDVSHFEAEFAGLDYSLKTGIKGRGENFGIFYFRGETGKQISKSLKQYGLLGKKSGDKFIPTEYKLSSIPIRYQIVQGLMDTDGTADGRGHVSYTTISKRLAEDMAFILRSSGAVVTITTRIPKYNGRDGEKMSGQLAYTLYIKHRDPAKLFKLQRKRERVIDFKQQTMYKKIVGYEILPKEPTRCITVSHPNGLYITNDFIVTHNSKAVRDLAILFGFKYNVQSLIFRRYRDDLLKNHINPLLKERPNLRPYFNKSEFILYNKKRNPIIKFDYADREDEIEKVGQGTEYPIVFIDEATQSTQGMIEYLTTCNRDSENLLPSIPKTIMTMNPGGISHTFLKRIFIDMEYEENEDPESYFYIQARLWDNVLWVAKDLRRLGIDFREYYEDWTDDQRRDFAIENSAYAKRLSKLPRDKMLANLYGDWDAFGGKFFKEFSKSEQLVKPFRLPQNWELGASMDPGFASPLSFGLWTKSPKGVVYRIATYYERNTIPNHARNIFEWITSEVSPIYPITRGRMPDWIVSGRDAFQKVDKHAIISNEDTVEDYFAEYGLYLEPADTSRISGWWKMKALMPERFKIFEGLNKPLISQLSAVESDPLKPEDIKGLGNNKDVEDHCLAPETIVKTTNGEFKIIDLVGTEGEVITEGGRVVPYRNCRKTRRDAETIKLTFPDGYELICTPDHKILTISGEMICAEELEGKYVVKKDKELLIVKKIEPYKSMDVYCLVAEETHKFAIGNGIIVSNCLDDARYGINRIPTPFLEKEDNSLPEWYETQMKDVGGDSDGETAAVLI